MRRLISDEPLKESTKLSVDVSKIQRHEKPITGLELHLTEWPGGSVSASVSLEGFSAQQYQVYRWNSRAEAEREFSTIVEKFKLGKYRIDIYDNEKVEVTLLD